MYHYYIDTQEAHRDMKKDKITVADIAKKAGVSPATVSRVLRHRELVKSETIQQVENAMSALGCLLE